jgi:iron complex outermembrane receptor protein
MPSSQLGANHPDNPYFGSAARLRYLAADVGPRESHHPRTSCAALGRRQGQQLRLGLGHRPAVLAQPREQHPERLPAARRRLRPAQPDCGQRGGGAQAQPAYAALPPGTFWRIGENAGLNSPACTRPCRRRSKPPVPRWPSGTSRPRASSSPLPPTISAWRSAPNPREATELRPTTGTERGNIIGLGYSAYRVAQRGALYTEGAGAAALQPRGTRRAALGPLHRRRQFLDAEGRPEMDAARSAGPARHLRTRLPRAEPGRERGRRPGRLLHRRRPGALRAGRAGRLRSGRHRLITSPNPALSPERSRSYNLRHHLGSAAAHQHLDRLLEDQAQERDQPGTGRRRHRRRQVVRDPTSRQRASRATPAPIIAVLARYVNSASDQGARHRRRCALHATACPTTGAMSCVDAKYTHLFEWLRTERTAPRATSPAPTATATSPTARHAGQPRQPALRLGPQATGACRSTPTYRGAIENKLFRGDTDCASRFANGAMRRAAANWLPSSASTWWALETRPAWEVFGSIQNLFDKVAPLDPLTYGAQAYNPLDYEGARGRSFSVGARYTFNKRRPIECDQKPSTQKPSPLRRQGPKF